MDTWQVVGQHNVHHAKYNALVHVAGVIWQQRLDAPARSFHHYTAATPPPPPPSACCHIIHETGGWMILTLMGPDWMRMGRVVLAHELAVGDMVGNVL